MLASFKDSTHEIVSLTKYTLVTPTVEQTYRKKPDVSSPKYRISFPAVQPLRFDSIRLSTNVTGISLTLVRFESVDTRLPRWEREKKKVEDVRMAQGKGFRRGSDLNYASSNYQWY
ncbi:hypothetical protein TWF569_002405 [Orbilia oligospora]|nr:hypothetical protein TWF569_002405 [Orbilia oligospora]